MRFRLRTLLILAGVAPPILAFLVWANTPPDPERPRNAAAREATAELRQLLASATSLEIVEAGNAFPPRAKSFEGPTLKRIADAANIVEVFVLEKDVSFTVVQDAYLHFRIMKNEQVLREYWFLYPE